MGLLKIFSARIYWVIFFMFVFLFTSQAVAQNKVVVIPLFGDEQTLSNPAPVEKTGQTEYFILSGDGNLQKGVAWPNPRFTDNGDGTVTDNLTGLIWMKDADCFGEKTWQYSIAECYDLASGSCGLTDGSSAGDWRLPNVKELQSLFSFGWTSPALSNTSGTGKWSEGDAFIGVRSAHWYSSTTYAGDFHKAWFVGIYNGYTFIQDKGIISHVWCVRGGN